MLPQVDVDRECLAAAAAQTVVMPFDQALAEYEIGRHLASGDASRRVFLSNASQRFGRVGARNHQERTRQRFEAGS